MWEDGQTPHMKAPAVLFLFAFLSAAAGAEQRLIPFDEFYLSVPVTEVPNPKGLEVTVWLKRQVSETLGISGISVYGSALPSPDKSLDPDDQTALMEACAAALKGQDFRKEVLLKSLCIPDLKTVYEVVTVEGRKRVRIGRGGVVFLDPEEGTRLKEALARAVVAETWYMQLLRARTLPVKTAAAHPPKAAGYHFSAEVGKVSGEGLVYELVFNHDYLQPKAQSQIMGELYYKTPRGLPSPSCRDWVERMMDQVVLALNAVEKKQAFVFESPPDGTEISFSVTANLAKQRADMVFNPGSYLGEPSPGKGSFGLAQLASIHDIRARGDACKQWLAEHESWFFEGQEGK